MFFFDPTKRKRLLHLLSTLISDERTFARLTKGVYQDISALAREDVGDVMRRYDEYEKDAEKTIEKAQTLIKDDVQIMYLLYELRKKGTLHFSGQEQERTFQEIFALCKEIGREVNELIEILEKSGRTKYYEEWGHLRDYSLNRMALFLRSEELEVTELEASMRGGIDISKRLIFTLTDGSLRVELHQNYQHITLTFRGAVLTRGGLDNPEFARDLLLSKYPWGLLIYDYDILVAAICITEFVHREMVCKTSVTYVKRSGYVQRAIELLLLRKFIKAWHSDADLSVDARRMYERLLKDPRFIVDGKGKKFFRVRLAK